jgi:serine O-acetyltransferase
MILHAQNLGTELKRWFDKSIYLTDALDFNDEATFGSVLEIFTDDYRRYFPGAEKIEKSVLLSRHELVGILLYRIARYYFLNGNEKAAAAYSNLATFLCGFEIYYSASIGRGLKINHGLGTVIGARSVIGENALLHHNITLGDKDGGRPTLEDQVTVYPGAKILGAITIGKGSVIGANTVCMKTVPENSIVAGNPSRIIKK